MKKLLLLGLVVIQSVFLFGQGSIELLDHDENVIVNGQDIEVIVEDLSIFETVSPEVFAKNISSASINVKIRVEEIDIVEGTSHYFCGLGSCFPPGTTETPIAWNIAPNETIGQEGFFSSHYMPAGIAGTTILRYIYFNVDDLNDTVSFTVTFNGNEVMANTIELYDEEGAQVMNGEDLEVIVEDLNLFETVSPEIFAKNISSEIIRVKIRVEEIAVVDETSHYFCGLGNCFPPGTMETPNPYAIEPDELIGEAGFFSSHYMPAGHAGTTIIRYTYYNVDDLNDTISFSVTFIGEDTPEEPIFKLFDAEGTEIVEGEDIPVQIEDLEAIETVSPEVFIMNNTDMDISLKCKREVVSEVEGTHNYFCALGVCLSPDISETTREFILGAGQTGDEESVFSAHYSANGINGTSTFKYTFSNVNNEEEMISFTVTFLGIDGVADINNEVELNAYPNPATSLVSITLSENKIKQAELVIYNAIGLKVYSQRVDQNTVQLDLSSLDRGVYLYRVEGAGVNTRTSKLVLK